jgi:hypothetical protein
MVNVHAAVTTLYDLLSRVSDPDPDSGSGSRRAKKTTKVEKIRNFCSFDVLSGGLGIGKL